MKILIVENEIYLAQSISTKLTELGHNCEVATTIKDAIKDEEFNAVLLSTNISGQNFYPVIEHYQSAIVILMVTYVSNDTVSGPLKAGADDYILKPFMIEELIRKLNHLQDYISFKKENETYRSYIDHLLKKKPPQEITAKTKLPVLLRVNYQKNADAIVFKYAQDYNESFTFISLDDADAISQLRKIQESELIYLINFQNLKKSDKLKILSLIQNRRVILSTTDMNDICEGDIECIDVKNDEGVFEKGDILSIENYVKYIIVKYQNKFPDTELSKKLGISRKSLWEKRKKYGISKKK
ncbi:MAG TPA: response regulator transcription factor [Campylobacteraceae bacterium]|nr:response regulator transcription factor [Campylobacteraceae bacterium]HHD83357.1 response regulator transcription factor [Campylobacteraceae bacterium]